MRHASLARFALLLVALLLPTGHATAARRPVCDGGTWLVEGLPPLAVGAERALGDLLEIDLDAGTVRISGCEPVAAQIKGKRNDKIKAEFPAGACPTAGGAVKLKAKLGSDCDAAKIKIKTAARQKRKAVARRAGAVVAVLEEERAVSETIGPAGGTLEATDAAGRRYVLEVPEGAIPAERLVTLTPVAALDGIPVDRLLGAADFEPAGLVLWPFGTLTIEFPSPVDFEGFVGFGYDDARGIEPLQAVLGEQSIEVPVFHFSGAGSGTLPGAATSFANQVNAAVAAGNAQAVAQVCATWYDSLVAPLVASASGNVATSSALLAFADWQTYCSASQPQRDAQGKAALTPLLEAALARSQADCPVLRSYQAVADAYSWASGALSVGITAASLTEEAVVAGTCLEVSYVDTSFPGTPSPGVAHPLSVTVGGSFGAGPVDFSQPLRVDVTATGATPTQASDLTDTSGQWSDSFIVTGGQDVVFQITSCIAAPGYPALSSICQPALVVRGLQVEPSSASIEEGDTQQFTAQRFGVDYPSVQWSASGGTIDSNGLFTAPNAVGSHTITATDTLNPGSQATATVTVTASGGGDDDGGGNGNPPPPGACATPVPGPVSHAVSADVRAGGTNDRVESTTGASTSVASGACSASASAPSLGRVEATVHGEDPDCDSVRATATTQDGIRITPADDAQVPTTIEARIARSISGTASPAQAFTVLRGRVAGLAPLLLESGSGFSDSTNVTLSEPIRNGGTFHVSFSAFAEGFPVSGGTVDVTASARWLGITRVLDQNGAQIFDYELCSNSGTDYRQAVP